MSNRITVKKYIEKLIENDKYTKELMFNMSITTLPVSKIFRITGELTPEQLYIYINNPENHVLLAELGFANNPRYVFESYVDQTYLEHDEELLGTHIEDIMYEEILPSKQFYKKKQK